MKPLGHRNTTNPNQPMHLHDQTGRSTRAVAKTSRRPGTRAGSGASVPGFLLAVLLGGAFPAPLRAQSFAINWHTIDGGGGASSGGPFSLRGTIGQPDAGSPMTGGGFALSGGFWSLFAVQTPGAPLLTIRLTSPNTAVISWPSSAAGFTLQQNSDLNTPNWTSAPQTVSDNGTNKFITVNSSTGQRFYRLCQP